MTEAGTVGTAGQLESSYEGEQGGMIKAAIEHVASFGALCWQDVTFFELRKRPVILMFRNVTP